MTRRQSHQCPIAMEHGYHVYGLADMHHRLHNTETNRRIFPRFIHSLLNLLAVSHAGHIAQPYYRRIYIRDADRMEKTLARWPKACAFVNGQTEGLGWNR